MNTSFGCAQNIDDLQTFRKTSKFLKKNINKKYTFKEVFNDIGDNNIQMLQDQMLGQISAQGWDTLTEQQQEFMSILYPNAFQSGKIKAGSARSKIGNNTPNTTTTDFIENIEGILTNELNVLTRNFDGSIPLSEVVNTEADKRIENGELRQSNKEDWMSQRTQFLQTEILSGGFENQLQIMKSSLAGDPEALTQMAILNARIQQQYYDSGYYDQIAVGNMALADTLASFYGIKGEPGFFGQPDRAAQAIRTPRMQVGRGSKWAELLNVKYTDIYSDANKRIDNGAVTYRRLDTKAKKNIEDIFLNLSDWENGKGIYADDYVPQNEKEPKIPASYRMQDKVLRYASLRKFAEVLSNQPSKDSELTNRIEKAIVSADKLTTEGRNDFNDAYIQLRRAIDSELTMFNVAFGTTIQAQQRTPEPTSDPAETPTLRDQMIDMAIQQGANPEDIDFEGTAEAEGVLEKPELLQVSDRETGSELFGGLGMPQIDSIADLESFVTASKEYNYTFNEAEQNFIDSERIRLQDAPAEEGKSARQIAGDILFWGSFLVPATYGIKSLNIGTKATNRIAKSVSTVIKGTNFNKLKSSIDASLYAKGGGFFGPAPAYINKIKDAGKRSIELARWRRKQIPKVLKDMKPAERLAIVRDSKFYKTLNLTEKSVVDTMIKSPSYKYGGKLMPNNKDFKLAVARSMMDNIKLAGIKGIKDYGLQVGAGTIGGSIALKRAIGAVDDSLLRRSFEDAPFER